MGGEPTRRELLGGGRAIIPHVHNAMVSAHLVVAGSFRARTHDRVRDLDDAVVLRPSIDRELAAEADGTIVAPAMTFEACVAKYAG